MRHLLPHCLTLLLVSILSAACSDTVSTTNFVVQTDTTTRHPVWTDTTFEVISIGCKLYPEQLGPTSPYRLVRTRSEYEALQRQMLELRGHCRDTTFPEIDFSRHSLLGTMLHGSGCTLKVPTSYISIKRNHATKSVLLRVIGVVAGFCDEFHTVMHWMVVPAIPADYTITATVKVIQQ